MNRFSAFSLRRHRFVGMSEVVLEKIFKAFEGEKGCGGKRGRDPVSSHCSHAFNWCCCSSLSLFKRLRLRGSKSNPAAGERSCLNEVCSDWKGLIGTKHSNEQLYIRSYAVCRIVTKKNVDLACVALLPAQKWVLEIFCSPPSLQGGEWTRRDLPHSMSTLTGLWLSRLWHASSVIASFLLPSNADHPRHLSDAKLRLVDQKCWSVKRRPTFLWGRIHFVNRDLSTHRVCVVFIGHIGAPVKSLINWLLKQGREEPTLSVFECNGEKIFEYNFCRCTKDWRMKRC